jgi:hypothetical protein
MNLPPNKRSLSKVEDSLDHYYSLESMEGVSPPPAQARPHWSSRLPKGAFVHDVYPGMIAAGTVGMAATWLSQHYNAPVMLFALLLGMAFRFLHEEGRCVRGIEFSARTILRIGVALLRLRITFGQIASLGIEPVIIVVTGVATTIAFGLLLARLLGLGANFGYLSGGAVGICGASAALAISSTLPAYDKRERDTVLTVVGVTTLSTIAMIFYPVLVSALHLDHAQAGMFLGGSIHDVAQVVGRLVLWHISLFRLGDTAPFCKQGARVYEPRLEVHAGCNLLGRVALPGDLVMDFGFVCRFEECQKLRELRGVSGV